MALLCTVRPATVAIDSSRQTRAEQAVGSTTSAVCSKAAAAAVHITTAAASFIGWDIGSGWHSELAGEYSQKEEGNSRETTCG